MPTDTNRILRTGLAAFGMASRVFHAPLIAAEPGLDLTAVASIRPEAVAEALPDVRVLPDPLTLCRDSEIDLVVITTPNDTHAPLAEAALGAGKHVVVEKPFTLSAWEAERLLRMAERSGLTLTVFQNRRWDSDFLTLRNVIASGRIGRPVQLESHFDRFRPIVPDRWRDRPGSGSGLWYDLGPHLLDQALQLFGMPEGMTVDLASLRDGAQTDDYLHAVLDYDRLRVILHATTLAAAEAPRFVLHGTSGSFEIRGLDPQEGQLKAGMRPGQPGWGEGAPDGTLIGAHGEEPVARRAGDYRPFYTGVRAAIETGALPPVTPQEALDLMRMLDAGRASAREGRRIRLQM
ncbi:oxidoreductase [Lutibaculum baratangense]|uniref:Putative oxidoreductase ydgJ n=1 Tax=Lutibaculum baratangense AMV1 TaxID=631454 RepID=V4TKW5_9HYPH|nr:oxidoreductase [Lutibaculum baratangense]ESR26463.1 putative oxidoreductase ydgJ [Lutibaculum baratangense AMV1]